MGRKKYVSAKTRANKVARDTLRLNEYVKAHRNDPEYRAKKAEGSRRHLEQVYRDAELGRMAREVLNGLGDMLIKLADASRALRAMMAAGEKAERSSAIRTEEREG